MESKPDGSGGAARPRRAWLLGGLAAGLLLVACLALCSVGAFWVYRTVVGDPPGQGARAERGFQAAVPIIAALEKYHQDHGQYPATLDALRRDPPDAVPATLTVDGYAFTYHAAAGSYTLAFSYSGPGMNHCTYTPETQWKCFGYY